MRFDFADWEAVQPGSDAPVYLPATPETVRWGRLFCAADDPVLTVAPGTVVTIDTLSHEGALPDQGQDPVVFFAQHGVPEALVLHDAIALASHGARRPEDGPHLVTGPVAVEGAEPGDLLRVDVLELAPRVPYGVISNRHGRGALPGEYPESGVSPVSVFAVIEDDGDRYTGVLPRSAGSDAVVRFPLAPFLGIMGVAAAGDESPHSVPPGAFGGNLDIRLLVEGTSLYLPVQVPGALFATGDPHYAQGDGEVALTALEAPLRATLRLDVVPRERAEAEFGVLRGPLARTPEYLVPTGLHEDLDEALRACVRAAIDLLHARYGMDRAHALAYLSAATDFDVSQVVDLVQGVHARIRLADFED